MMQKSVYDSKSEASAVVWPWVDEWPILTSPSLFELGV